MRENGSLESYRLCVVRAALAAFCRRWKIRSLEVFGSVLREDFGPDSDLDMLVTFEPAAEWSLFDHLRMTGELAAIVGRDVDLVSRRAVERSHNWIRRQAILGSSRPFYDA
jgi:predicted nucleotidyltransferase